MQKKTHKQLMAFMLLILFSFPLLPSAFAENGTNIGDSEQWEWGVNIGDFVGYKVETTLTEHNGIPLMTTNYIGLNVSDITTMEYTSALQLTLLEYNADTGEIEETDDILAYDVLEDEGNYRIKEHDPWMNAMFAENAVQNILVEFPCFLILPVNMTSDIGTPTIVNGSYWYNATNADGTNRTEVVNVSPTLHLDVGEEPPLSSYVNYTEAYGFDEIMGTQNHLVLYNSSSESDNQIHIEYNTTNGILQSANMIYTYIIDDGDVTKSMKVEHTWTRIYDKTQLNTIQGEYTEDDSFTYIQRVGGIDLSTVQYSDFTLNTLETFDIGMDVIMNYIHEINSHIKTWDMDSEEWVYLYPWQWEEGTMMAYQNDHNSITYPMFMEQNASFEILEHYENQFQLDGLVTDDAYLEHLFGLNVTIANNNWTIIDAVNVEGNTNITIDGEIEENQNEHYANFLGRNTLDDAFSILPAILHPIGTTGEDLDAYYYNFYRMSIEEFMGLYLIGEKTIGDHHVTFTDIEETIELSIHVNPDGSLALFQLTLPVEMGSMTIEFEQIDDEGFQDYLYGHLDIDYAVDVGDELIYHVTNATNQNFNQTYNRYVINEIAYDTIELDFGSTMASIINASVYNWTQAEEESYYIWDEIKSPFEYKPDGEEWVPTNANEETII